MSTTSHSGSDAPLHEPVNDSTAPVPLPQNADEPQNTPSEIPLPFAPIVPPLPPSELSVESSNASGAESGLDFSTSKPEIPEQSFDFSAGPVIVPGVPDSFTERGAQQFNTAEFRDDTKNLIEAPDEATPQEPDEAPAPSEAPPITPPITPPPPPAKSNLAARIITAIIGIPIVALLVWRADATQFNLVVAFLALLGLRELSKALRAAQLPLVGTLAYPALIALLFVQPLSAGSFSLPGDDAITWSWNPRWGAMVIWVMPFLLMVCLLITSVLRYPSSRRISLQAIALTLFATLYAGLFVFLILLRSLRSGPLDFLDDAPRLGYSLLWLTLLSVWAGDIVAYFAGRKMGKEKLTPLSPGKTWAGAVAGLAATIAVCVPVSRLLEIELRHGLALGVLIALAAPLGDLAESFWKRELAIKDMGGVLPGHGGILDRCDSLLFAAFAVYLYAQIWML